MSCLNNNCSYAGLDLVGLSSSLAIFISQTFNLDDLVILSAFFTTLGDNLALISTSKSICESKNSDSPSLTSSNLYEDFLHNSNNKF